MSGHTKGLWQTGSTYRTHNHPTRFWETSVFNNGEPVATSHGATKQEAVELAQLLTAAPDLLEALKECEWSDGGGCPQCAATRGEPHQSKCILGNALDKAEGK
jgi:hypothetical protein